MALCLIILFFLLYRYTIIKSNTSTYGTCNHITKAWNGLVGDITNKVAEIAVGDVDMTLFRTMAIDFTTPINNEG